MWSAVNIRSTIDKKDKKFFDPDVIWTRNLPIWSRTRYRCATESYFLWHYLMSYSITLKIKASTCDHSCSKDFIDWLKCTFSDLIDQLINKDIVYYWLTLLTSAKSITSKPGYLSSIQSFKVMFARQNFVYSIYTVSLWLQIEIVFTWGTLNWFFWSTCPYISYFQTTSASSSITRTCLADQGHGTSYFSTFTKAALQCKSGTVRHATCQYYLKLILYKLNSISSSCGF